MPFPVSPALGKVSPTQVGHQGGFENQLGGQTVLGTDLTSASNQLYDCGPEAFSEPHLPHM